MKHNEKKMKARRFGMWMTGLALVCAVALFGAGMVGTNVRDLTAAVAEANAPLAAEPAADPSPAIYVAQKNANSVVGVTTYVQNWSRQNGEITENAYAQGSGVVIADGYVLTNYHVIEGGDAWKILLANGEEVEASLKGSDSSVDLAVLQVTSDAKDQLIPVAIGTSNNLIIGSTVVAIGNPGGEVLANTVTQGIVSALERSSLESSNTTRSVAYIQHDAPINSGNSGGGLFNYKGELIGINTLKYAGSAYSSVSFEGLGFAIPVDTAYPIAMQLIEKGKVVRPQMGITVSDYEGPNEPMSNYAPASVCIRTINENSPAQKAGLRQYDFITAINGERVKSFRELTAILDNYQAGDTVSVTVVRYGSVYTQSANNNKSQNYYDPFGGFFGGFGFGFGNGNGNGGYDNYGSSQNDNSANAHLIVSGGFEYVTVDVVLELPSEEEQEKTETHQN